MMTRDDCEFILARGLGMAPHEVQLAVLATLLRVEVLLSRPDPAPEKPTTKARK